MGTEKTARLLFLPLRGRAFIVRTDEGADPDRRPATKRPLPLCAEKTFDLTQGDPRLRLETFESDGQEIAHLVVSNLGDRALMTFYDRASGVCGQQVKLHPNQAQEVKILRPDLFGLAFACAP